MAESPGRPLLSGYRVLDVAQPLGFHCVKLLADMGADVVKVEPPAGDPARRVPPFKDDLPHTERSLYFLHYNTNKRGVTLDLEAPEGRQLFLELARRADVLVETYPPGRMEELGRGYDTLRALNPGLVMASVTPFGQTGPWRDYKATDIAGMALSNFMVITGEPGEAPVQGPAEIAYGMASTYAAFGIAVALYHRRESGQGQRIDVSMHECAAHIGGYFIPNYSYSGVMPHRVSRKAEVVDLYDAYEASNGYVRLFIIPVEQWRRLVEWMGSPELVSDPLFDDMEFRRQNTDLIHRTIADFCKRHTKEELYEEGQRRRISITPLNTAREFVESPQTVARELFVEMEHPEVGRYRHFGPIPRLSDTPGQITRTAPLLGQHNQEVYCGELGLSKQDLAALAAVGAI